MSYRRIAWLITTGLASLILLVSVGIWLQHRQAVATTHTEPMKNELTYHFDGLDSQQETQIKDALNEYYIDSLPLRYQAEEADIIFRKQEDPGDFTLPGESQPSNILTADLLSTQTDQVSIDAPNLPDTKKTQLIKQIQKNQPASWTYLALGDIIPARDVYTYAKQRGWLYPYLKIRDQSRAADLTIANVEATLADQQAFLEGSGVLNFTAPAKALDGLVDSGIDGVSLANNHAMNGGGVKVAEMLQLLDRSGIGHFGVAVEGADASWQTTVKGLRITHLSFNTVPGSINPTVSLPGTNRVPLAPWGSLSTADIQGVTRAIREAKQSADIVIPWFHWGTEYTHQANQEQRRLAQAAIDAGASVVIGSHPHWTQGVEWYQGRLIAYSLGNLVFDQNWSEETRRSTALELTFHGNQLIQARLKPVFIENLIQPRWLNPNEYRYSEILRDIAGHSWWPTPLNS